MSNPLRLYKTFLLVVFALIMVSCGVNPVTGKREVQFISTAQEIQMGKQNYMPARQSQGGDYVVDKSITAYVQQVNNRLAAVSDRQLPYEIEIINSSIPNAWAMPGGKMAINRGLLTELQSEAELAAVLGHEIVHAAARHSAQSMERGLFLQGALIATQIGTQGSEYGNLLSGGAAVGAQLINTKYGREAELESDHYGMEYMVKAGYNPQAAVDLQKTFVRLSEGRQTNWLEGLFSTHPPSTERVIKNQETARRLGGQNLEYGRERYKRAIATLIKDKPAYDALDDALEAAEKKDFSKANALVDKAIRLQPRESKFYGLKGDIALHQKQYKSAVSYFDQAINLYSNYFAFHLNQGYAKQKLGDTTGARRAFEKSNSLLPTPNAQKALGEIALVSGNRQQAIQYFSSAAKSNSAVGKQAYASLVRLDLPTNPARYIKTSISYNAQGKVQITVGNTTGLAVGGITLQAYYVDVAGRPISSPQTLRVRKALSASEGVRIPTNFNEANGLRVKVVEAKIIN